MEQFTGETIPKLIVDILTNTGYDTPWAIQSIKCEQILKIECHINAKSSRFENIFKGTVYEEVTPFELLPGHEAMVLNLPKVYEQMKMVEKVIQPKKDDERDKSNYSVVLKSLIETVEKNKFREPKGRRFDEPIHSYATYLYLMSGKACYQSLCANLPIPQADTVCKF